MSEPVTIVGSPVSPYVRKALIALEVKGVPYRIDPQIPFLTPPEFSQISPLRRVPVYLDGPFVLNDSSVICEFLDETHGGTPLYPAEPRWRAKARWFEEYADDHLGRNIVFSLFFQKVIRPFVLKEEGDKEMIRKAEEETLPAALDYLEGVLPEVGFLFGDRPMMADFALSTMLLNARYAGFEVDAARRPTVAGWRDRCFKAEPLARLHALSDTLLTTRRNDVQGVIDAYLAERQSAA